MKILQIVPSLASGGVERGTIEIAEFLQRNAIENYVCSAGGSMVSDLKKIGVENITLSVHSKNPITIIANIYRIIKIVKKYQIDIVHVRSRAPAWSCYFAHKLSNFKLVTTFHGAYSISSYIKKLYNIENLYQALPVEN